MHTRSSATRAPGPVVLAIVPAIGWTALVVFNVVLLMVGIDVEPGLHSLGIAGVVVASLAALNLYIDQRRRAHLSSELATNRAHVSSEMATMYGMLSRRIDMIDPTQPIPKPLVVVGTAPVKTDDELPGYAKGYVDGLSRKPMVDGKIIPFGRS